MAARVVVVGGGYGGASLARQLDPDLDVVLIEPKDAFVHASAALRAVVDPQWQSRVFFPYDRLLARGQVIRNWARRVTPRTVQISPFESVDADYLVLATGTAYPFPAKYLEDETDVAIARLERLREALGRTERVLLVGGGSVGLELASELTAAFPHLRITVADRADDVLTTGDYLPDLRQTVREQLEARGVEFVTGAPLAYLPPVDVGLHAPFTVETTQRQRIDAQMWFRCYGARPHTSYLDEELAASRRPDGHLRVTDHLTVVGQEHVFAIGDIRHHRRAGEQARERGRRPRRRRRAEHPGPGERRAAHRPVHPRARADRPGPRPDRRRVTTGAARWSTGRRRAGGDQPDEGRRPVQQRRRRAVRPSDGRVIRPVPRPDVDAD